MAKKKPIYTVVFIGSMGVSCQSVKANDAEDAERKFLKAYPKKNKEDHIIDIDLLEPDHKNYRILASSAI